MSWICNKMCGYENDDSVFVCVACGTARPARLVLTSETGSSWRTMIETDVTRSVYRRLYPGVEHQYVPRNDGEHPFSVVKARNTDEWQLKANVGSPIRTVLNATVCEGGRCYGLKPGDVITIASPANVSKTFAPLTVELQPIA